MRRICGVLCGVVFVVLIFVISAGATETLRVSTWGGNYNKSYAATVGDFERRNDCKVEWVVGSCADFMVRARLGQLDVVTNDLAHSILGETEGLWLQLDEQKAPNMENLYTKARYSQHTVFTNVGDYAMAYNSRHIKEPPTSWDALWNPAYKNRVAIYYFGSTGTTSLMVLQAARNGGGLDNIEPGMSRMVELSKSGNLVGMIEAETQLVSLFELQEAWIGMLGTGRIKDLWDRGADFIKIVRPPEGTFPMISTINVVKSTKKPDLAMKFVDHVLGPENQQTFAVQNLYAPSVRNAVIPPDFKYKALLITGDAFDNLFIMDLYKANKLKPQWGEQFNRMVSK